MPYPFPDSSVPPPPLKKKGRTMPPDDPNDTAGMMEWLKQVPPPGGPVGGAPPPVKAETFGPFTKVQSIQAPLPGAKPPVPAAAGPSAMGQQALGDMGAFQKMMEESLGKLRTPVSPEEEALRGTLPPIAATRGMRTTFAYPQLSVGGAPAPEYDTPRLGASLAHDRGEQDRQKQLALLGDMSKAFGPALGVQGQLEAARIQTAPELAKNAFIQSPKGMMQGVTMGLINSGASPDQVALMVPQLERLLGASEAPAGGVQGAGPPLPADPIAGLSKVNPRLFSTVYDPKTGKKTADADSVEKFMDQVMAVDGGKMLEQNFPAIQAYANTIYGPNAISSAVSSPKSIQALERYNPVSRLVGPMSVLGKVPSVFEDLPKSPGAGYREAEAIAREAEMQRQQQAQIPMQERLWEGLGLNPAQAQRNQAFREAIRRYLASAPAASGQPAGQPPPLPKR